jgi:methionine S-methyltransferase
MHFFSFLKKPMSSRLQGFVEDQFGLGLIARAAEEGISIIRPTGRLIFNIGGRPGQAVTERVFTRRGFHINKLWQTRVNQVSCLLNVLALYCVWSPLLL